MTKKKQKRSNELIDEMIKEEGFSPEAILGQNGLMAQLTKAVMERALGAELTHHLGYGKGEKPPPMEGEPAEGSLGGQANCRNGSSKKTVIGEGGKVEIAVPRDRAGSFEPLLIRKGQKRFEGFDEKIIAMYARGMSMREIQGFLLDQYKVEVSAEFISSVTDAVVGQVQEWQNRPLERMYAVVYLDALRVKIRDEGTVRNKAVYLALGIGRDGTKEVLGLWIEQNEGAKFWLRVLNELRNRGLEDILIAVIDGLKGFPEAIEAVYPQTTIQTCIVHLVRHSLGYCNWKERQAVAQELKAIYNAENAHAAEQRLEEFAASALGQKYPTIVASWRRHWPEVIPFYAYPLEIRKMVYTTNAIESLHMQVRKVIKTRGHFPSEEAASKLIYLVLRKISREWKAPAGVWKAASNQFAIVYGERFEK
jgi:putative transposase